MALLTRRDDKAEALAELGRVLDKESYEWLLRSHPEVATAVENAVEAGASENDIKRLAWERTQRPEIVTRCVNAARYLVNGGGE